MQIKENFSRSFYPFGRKVTLEIIADLDTSQNADMAQQKPELLRKILLICLIDILPIESLIAKPLLNQRGRDLNLRLDQNANTAIRAEGNELFYFNASYLAEDEELDPESRILQNFEISFHTKFLNSTRDQGYFFDIKEHRNNLPVIFESKTIREILGSDQLKINAARIGIYDYRFPGFLPLAPIIYAKFCLDLNPQKLFLRFSQVFSQTIKSSTFDRSALESASKSKEQTGLYSSKKYNPELLNHFNESLKLLELINPSR